MGLACYRAVDIPSKKHKRTTRAHVSPESISQVSGGFTVKLSDQQRVKIAQRLCQRIAPCCTVPDMVFIETEGGAI
jgi:ABC-type hemin transport system ATPase subunit